jgi:hypothetical protein
MSPAGGSPAPRPSPNPDPGEVADHGPAERACRLQPRTGTDLGAAHRRWSTARAGRRPAGVPGGRGEAVDRMGLRLVLPGREPAVAPTARLDRGRTVECLVLGLRSSRRPAPPRGGPRPDDGDGGLAGRLRDSGAGPRRRLAPDAVGHRRRPRDRADVRRRTGARASPSADSPTAAGSRGPEDRHGGGADQRGQRDSPTPQRIRTLNGANSTPRRHPRRRSTVRSLLHSRGRLAPAVGHGSRCTRPVCAQQPLGCSPPDARFARRQSVGSCGTSPAPWVPGTPRPAAGPRRPHPRTEQS